MENHQEYAIHIVSKNHEISEAIKTYIQNKLAKVERLTNNIIDVHVRIEVQKLDHIVNIVMKFSHFNVQAHAMTHDLYLSVDRAVEKLQRKLYKWKTKIQDHHNRQKEIISVPVDVFAKTETYLDAINDAIEDENISEAESLLAPPSIVKTKTRSLKTLKLEEALMKMELSADNFLVYRSEEDQKLKVVYRRRDQSYGLLQPE
ncbi:MAG: ribosome-associated translation inhibitor RaiA [Simkaniaceae bacterium]|nr:ribosome-associated translation inhibitor RaiA [Simkaniaceae bacterium]